MSYCICGCGNEIEQNATGARRLYYRSHRTNHAVRKHASHGNAVSKSILKSLGRDGPFHDNREVPSQSYGIWKTGLYFVLACGIIGSMTSCSKALPSEPTAPLQEQNRCSQPPYSCSPGATDCYLLTNLNPGQGPDSVCVYGGK
jgi:hypothetical protein